MGFQKLMNLLEKLCMQCRMKPILSKHIFFTSKNQSQNGNLKSLIKVSTNGTHFSLSSFIVFSFGAQIKDTKQKIANSWLAMVQLNWALLYLYILARNGCSIWWAVWYILSKKLCCCKSQFWIRSVILKDCRHWKLLILYWLIFVNQTWKYSPKQ
jgi:hypothetical protein